MTESEGILGINSPSLDGGFRPTINSNRQISTISAVHPSSGALPEQQTVSNIDGEIKFVGGTPLLHIKNELNGIVYLVGSDAEVCLVLPKKEDLNKPPSLVQLTAANGSRIRSSGMKRQKIKLKYGDFSGNSM